MDKSKLIDKWFEQNHALIFNNVEIYMKTGYVKGAFKQMLIEMLQEFEQDMQGQKPQSNDGNNANTVLATVNFYQVGQLRKALEGLPDDRFIACQVVAKDGKAWNMWGEFCPQVPQGTIACLTFRHDELETLP